MTPALTTAQATLELTAEHVGKRLTLLGIEHHLGTLLLEAVAGCRAARTVGKVPAAATLAAAPRLDVPDAQPVAPSVQKNNALIARRQALDAALRMVLRRLGNHPTLFDALVQACEDTAASRAHYKNRHSHRGAIRESMHRLHARGELVIVQQKRGVVVIPAPGLLAGVAQRGAAA